jgi:hypothetical protein
MPHFIVQAESSLAVMLSALLLVLVPAWFALKKLDIVKSRVPFQSYDVRTWPLSFVLN